MKTLLTKRMPNGIYANTNTVVSLQSTYNLQSFGIATASLRSASRPFLSLVISSNFKMKNITKFEIPYLEEVMTL